MESVHIKRSIAFLIDIVISGIFATLIENFFPITFEINDFEILNIKFTWGITLQIVFYLLYLFVFDLLNNGNTLGKLLLSITVITKNKEVPALKKRLVRSLCKTVSVIILPVSALLFLFKNYYTIQDHYAGTITVKSK